MFGNSQLDMHNCLSLVCVVVPCPWVAGGYYGARQYSYWPTYVYAVYVVCEIIGCVVSFFLVNSPWFIAVRALYLVFCVYIVRWATRLAGYLLSIDDEDRAFLWTHPVISNYEKSLFW